MNLSQAISVVNKCFVWWQVKNFKKLIATAFTFKLNVGSKTVDIESTVFFKRSLQLFKIHLINNIKRYQLIHIVYIAYSSTKK